jgi:hypothetical protein
MRKKDGEVMKVDTGNYVKMAYGRLVIQGGQVLTWEGVMGGSSVFQVQPKSCC